VVTPDEPMHVEANAPVQPTETPKTLTGDKTTHQLIRHTIMQASVQPAIRKNSARAEQSFSSPRPEKNSMIERSNQVQSSSNFGVMKMMTSRTHPQKISKKFLTVEVESKQIGARTGFSGFSKNSVLEGSRLAGDLALG